MHSLETNLKSHDSCTSNPKSETSNRTPAQAGPICDFGFEVQESSDFKFPLAGVSRRRRQGVDHTMSQIQLGFLHAEVVKAQVLRTSVAAHSLECEFVLGSAQRARRHIKRHDVTCRGSAPGKVASN